MSRLNEPDTLGGQIASILSRLARIETGRRSAVAVVAADPTIVRDGDIWVRTSDGALRVRVGGVTKTATLT